MKEGIIEHWIEIPIKVLYSWHPAERQTHTYDGCSAHLEVDEVAYPNKSELDKIVNDKYKDEISEMCWEDMEP